MLWGVSAPPWSTYSPSVPCPGRFSSESNVEKRPGQSCPHGLVPRAACLSRPPYAAADVGENQPCPSTQALNKLKCPQREAGPKIKGFEGGDHRNIGDINANGGLSISLLMLMGCWKDEKRRMIPATPPTLKSQESEVGRLSEEREP